MYSHRRSIEGPIVEANAVRFGKQCIDLEGPDHRVHQLGPSTLPNPEVRARSCPRSNSPRWRFRHKDRQGMKAAVPYMHRASQSPVPLGRPHGSRAFYDLRRNRTGNRFFLWGAGTRGTLISDNKESPAMTHICMRYVPPSSKLKTPSGFALVPKARSVTRRAHFQTHRDLPQELQPMLISTAIRINPSEFLAPSFCLSREWCWPPSCRISPAHRRLRRFCRRGPIATGFPARAASFATPDLP